MNQRTNTSTTIEKKKKMAEAKAPGAETDKSQELFVAFDIEKKGSSLGHHILQIGAAYTTGPNAFVTTVNFCFDDETVALEEDALTEGVYMEPWEERCKREFWDKQPGLYERIKKAAGLERQCETWTRFVKWLDNLERMSDKVVVLSDNPTYDLGAIDHELYQRFGRLGVRYTKGEIDEEGKQTGGKYRPVKDPSERIKGLPKGMRDAIKAQLDKECPHTHWAPDDARRILKQYFLVQAAIEKLAQPNLVVGLLASSNGTVH